MNSDEEFDGSRGAEPNSQGDVRPASRNLHRGRRFVLVLSLGLFGLSLGLPIATPSQGVPEGYGALTFGFLAFILGGIEPLWSAASWFANWSFGATILTGRLPLLQRCLALVTLALCLLFLGVREMRVSESGPLASVQPGPAFYFWLASITLLNLFAWIPQGTRPPNQEPGEDSQNLARLKEQGTYTTIE